MRRALVTGGTRGIGRAIALALHEQGYRVYTTGLRKTGEDIDALLAGGIQYQCSDIADTEQHAKLMDWSQPEVLVNNAGMAPRERTDLLCMSEQSMREVLSVNLIGPFMLTQLAAKAMIANGSGTIVNIGSVSSDTASIQRGEYCVSKAGMSMMTALFATRLAAHGIGVYEIRPGIIATDMTAGVQDKYDALIKTGLLPIPRWGQPEDVAKAVVMLASGVLSYSTGDVLYVDGGMHIKRL